MLIAFSGNFSIIGIRFPVAAPVAFRRRCSRNIRLLQAISSTFGRLSISVAQGNYPFRIGCSRFVKDSIYSSEGYHCLILIRYSVRLVRILFTNLIQRIDHLNPDHIIGITAGNSLNVAAVCANLCVMMSVISIQLVVNVFRQIIRISVGHGSLLRISDFFLIFVVVGNVPDAGLSLKVCLDGHRTGHFDSGGLLIFGHSICTKSPVYEIITCLRRCRNAFRRRMAHRSLTAGLCVTHIRIAA